MTDYSSMTEQKPVDNSTGFTSHMRGAVNKITGGRAGIAGATVAALLAVSQIGASQQLLDMTRDFASAVSAGTTPVQKQPALDNVTAFRPISGKATASFPTYTKS
jgi:hypothetical protein